MRFLPASFPFLFFFPLFTDSLSRDESYAVGLPCRQLFRLLSHLLLKPLPLPISACLDIVTIITIIIFVVATIIIITLTLVKMVNWMICLNPCAWLAMRRYKREMREMSPATSMYSSPSPSPPSPPPPPRFSPAPSSSYSSFYSVPTAVAASTVKSSSSAWTDCSVPISEPEPEPVKNISEPEMAEQLDPESMER